MFPAARFKDVELASETLHSGIQLLSLYHDSLLARAMAGLPSFGAQKPSPHNRYTKFWTDRSKAYKRLAMVVTMIQYTELLWEMAAKRRGQKMRWRVVILLEVTKLGLYPYLGSKTDNALQGHMPPPTTHYHKLAPVTYTTIT